MFERIKKWHAMGLWTEAMVRNAVKKGVITREQADEILGSDDKSESGLIEEE